MDSPAPGPDPGSGAALDGCERLLLEESPAPGGTVLVIDSPALASHLVRCRPEVSVLACCDSVQDQRALPEGVHAVTLHQALPPLDLVWWRLPRSLDALDEIAGWVAPRTSALIATGRTKHMTPTMNPVLERYFDTVGASRGRYKSRVLHAHHPRTRTTSRWPRSRAIELDGSPLQVITHGATFATGKVDPGTALLLSRLDEICSELPMGARVLDWGSGAGILSLALGRRRPDLRLTAADISWAGWSATTQNVAAHDIRARALWADGNEVLTQGCFDAVISNPPFHQGAAKDSTPTLDMIARATSDHTTVAALWLVFNSHLPYLTAMRRAGSGEARIVARNRAFTVARWRAGSLPKVLDLD